MKLSFNSVSTSGCFNPFHPFFNGRFNEKRSLFIFFENAGALVFFLKSFKSFVDRFVIANSYADQIISPLSDYLVIQLIFSNPISGIQPKLNADRLKAFLLKLLYRNHSSFRGILLHLP